MGFKSLNLIQRLKNDRLLAAVFFLLLVMPLPLFLSHNGLLPSGAVSWPPIPYMQRGANVFVWAVFALSYDLLIGYTGIVSFGHSLFLALGAYAVAIPVVKLGMPLWVTILIAIAVSAAVSATIGMLSLRLRGHYFAMITLAFASVGHVLAIKMGPWTGGEDGLAVRGLPMWIMNRVNGYYVGLIFLVVMFLLVRRITRSPLGRVLEAVRENEFRAQALGYNVTAYKVGAMTIAGVVASLAGVAMAIIDSRHVHAGLSGAGPTIDVLMMTVLGGLGTLTGPMMGAAVVRLLAYTMPALKNIHPLFERWPLFVGILYVGIVMFLPYGIVGTYRTRIKQALERILPTPGGRKAA